MQTWAAWALVMMIMVDASWSWFVVDRHVSYGVFRERGLNRGQVIRFPVREKNKT